MTELLDRGVEIDPVLASDSSGIPPESLMGFLKTTLEINIIKLETEREIHYILNGSSHYSIVSLE